MDFLKVVNTDKVAANDIFSREIIDFSDDINEKITKAEEKGALVWVLPKPDDKISYKRLVCEGVNVYPQDEEIFLTTKNTIDRLSEYIDNFSYIDGIVINVPKFEEPVFCNEFYSMFDDNSNFEADELLAEIFDEDTPVSKVRQEFYEKSYSYAFSEYILPTLKYIKGLGKRAIFNIENPIMLWDFVLAKFDVLVENGIDIIFSGNIGDECGAILKALPEDFTKAAFSDDSNMSQMCDDKEQTLLIMPMRGMLARNVLKFRRSRVENSLIETAFESKYYCNRLKEHHLPYAAIDESTFEKYAKTTNYAVYLFGKEYKRTIICPSCAFSEIGTALLKELKTINDEEFLKLLDSDTEE